MQDLQLSQRKLAYHHPPPSNVTLQTLGNTPTPVIAQPWISMRTISSHLSLAGTATAHLSPRTSGDGMI